MKHTQIWIFLSVTVIAIAMVIIFTKPYSVAHADEVKSNLREIDVTGDAEIKTQPDTVILSFSAKTHNKDLLTAKSENDTQVKRIMTVAAKYGLDTKDIATEDLNISPTYRYTKHKTILTGYAVYKSIVVTIKDLKKFDPLFNGFINAGIKNVGGIRFECSNLRARKDEARARAVKAAKEKATAMAGGCGQKIGAPLQIVEDTFVPTETYNDRQMRAKRSNYVGEASLGGMDKEMRYQRTISPGVVSISAHVQITFSLVN